MRGSQNPFAPQPQDGGILALYAEEVADLTSYLQLHTQSLWL